MKTYNIEVQRVKAMANSTTTGLVRVQVDALVQASAPSAGAEPTTLLSFSEQTARVLLLLLKAQITEIDSRKAKSRR